MGDFRLKTSVNSHIILVFLLFFNALPAGAVDEITPDRSIAVVRSTPHPQWKDIWDAARELARKQKYQDAAVVYAQLFKIKPKIEEANFEYGKVLLKIKDFTGVAHVIEALLEIDPLRAEYQLMAGRVAFKNKDYLSAVHHFGRVLENDPAGEYSTAAIEGLSDSLRVRGRRELAFSLQEQLTARNSFESVENIYNLALDAAAIGETEKARWLFGRLLKEEKLDDSVIFQAIQVFDDIEHKETLVELLDEYVRRNPGYLPFRLRLAGYQEEDGDFVHALENLTYLIDHTEDDQTLLLRAADIAFHKINRPDKALGFFEKYNSKYPGDVTIELQIDRLQTVLANDFLAIVENDGAGHLWNDLDKVTPNRLAIFQKMAVIFEQNEKEMELIRILEIIYKKYPMKDEVAWRLATLFYSLEAPQDCLDYLKKIDPSKRNKKYHLLRADAELSLGLELEAIESYGNVLEIEPGNNELRIKLLVLCGKVGFVERQMRLFSYWMDNAHQDIPVSYVISHMKWLSFNYLLGEAEKVEHWAQHIWGGKQEALTAIAIEKSRVLRRVGKARSAEQLLRSLLNKKISVDKILFELAEDAIADKKIIEGKQWLTILEKKSYTGQRVYSDAEYGIRLCLVRGRLLQLQGAFGEARITLEHGRTEYAKLSATSQVIRSFLKQIYIELGHLDVYSGNYQKGLQFKGDVSLNNTFDPESFVLEQILEKKKNNSKDTLFGEEKLYIFHNPVVSKILQVAELELRYEQYDAAQRHLDLVQGEIANSLVAGVLQVDVKLEKSKVDIARQDLVAMATRFPQEFYFFKKKIDLEAQRGRYDTALRQFGRWYGFSDDTRGVSNHLANTNDIAGSLHLARLLWGKKQFEESLSIYEGLLSPSILDLLSQQFSEKKINYLYLIRDDSFWSSVVLLLQSKPDVVDELMEPAFLMSNLGNVTGEILSGNYEQYSWLRLINSEFSARKAMYRRNYKYAEKSYLKLLEEESSREKLVDLAAIYGRIGEYRKEAQIYEDIKIGGGTSPEIDEFIEQSSIKVSPQNIINGEFVKKQGRDEFIDLQQTSAGLSFWFTHDFNKDFKFDYNNNRYESIDGSQTTGSDSIRVDTSWALSENYELDAGVGSEKLNGESLTTFLYHTRLEAQLDDNLNGFLEVDKELVKDSVLSLRELITAASFSTGLGLDTFLGIGFGGDIRYRKYSDRNSQKRFHGYSSYSFFSETIHLDLRYDYTFLNNEKENPHALTDLDKNQFANDDYVTSYWSPDSLSEHRLGLYFQHDFLGYEAGGRRKMSYYAVDTAVALEDNETLIYYGKFDIFLEMSPHFLLKGNFSFNTSDVYEETAISASLHYRW